MNRLLAQRQLAELGHELEVVTGGEQAVQMAARGGYDVILMDRHMPNMDGLEAARRIRAQEQGSGRRVPIIVVTADALAQNREDCLAAGMDDFLTKPVDLTELHEALSRVRPTPTAPEPPRSGFDEQTLRQRARELGDAEAGAELVRIFLTELPGRRLLLQSALRRASAQQLVAAAQSLRTASEAVGALALAQVCAHVEAAGREARLTDARTVLPELIARCAEAQAALVSYQEPGRIRALMT